MRRRRPRKKEEEEKKRKERRRKRKREESRSQKETAENRQTLQKYMFSEACLQLFIYILKCFWGRGYVDIFVSKNTIFIYANFESI